MFYERTAAAACVAAGKIRVVNARSFYELRKLQESCINFTSLRGIYAKLAPV